MATRVTYPGFFVRGTLFADWVCGLPYVPCAPLLLSLPSLIKICIAQVFLVTEFMDGGDLSRRIRKDKTAPRQTSWYQQGRYIALGIARGLLYLHNRGIVWFDCKPGNVLLNSSGDVAKIADFGLARILETTYIMTHQVRKPQVCMILLSVLA